MPNTDDFTPDAAAAPSREQLVSRLYSRAGQAEALTDYTDPATGTTVRHRPSEWALIEFDRGASPTALAVKGASDQEQSPTPRDDGDDFPGARTPPSWLRSALIGGIGVAVGCGAMLGFLQLQRPAHTEQGSGSDGVTLEEYRVAADGTATARSPIQVGARADRPDPISISTGLPLPTLDAQFLEETIAFIGAQKDFTELLFLTASDVDGRICLIAVDASLPGYTNGAGTVVSPSTSSCTVPVLFTADGIGLDITTNMSTSVFQDSGESTEAHGETMPVMVSARWGPDGSFSTRLFAPQLTSADDAVAP